MKNNLTYFVKPMQKSFKNQKRIQGNTKPSLLHKPNRYDIQPTGLNIVIGLISDRTFFFFDVSNRNGHKYATIQKSSI